MGNNKKVNIKSEIGKLEAVILHKPGKEVENMTPENAERALYSDILNLDVAQKEYEQFAGVLNKVAHTYEVKDLLSEILKSDTVRKEVLDNIFANEYMYKENKFLYSLTNGELATQLIEGVKMKKDNLTKYLSDERYSLRPLHNFFFTRDASISVLDKVLIGKMANKVRDREALIMDSIFKYHKDFGVETVNPINCKECESPYTIEGGDILVAREDILLIGVGGRTSSQGVDFIINCFKEKKKSRHLIIQELPLSPESFIHLDMVFTLLDNDKCMVYEPLIMQQNRYQTVHITIDNGIVKSIKTENNLIDSLKKLGMDLKPIFCGGNKDLWIQEREQWHSGANFFAFAPGKVIGYGRNVHTIEEMSKNGFDVLKAQDVVSGKLNPNDYKSCVVTIDGAELPRGGGGARCMTMPVRRVDL